MVYLNNHWRIRCYKYRALLHRVPIGNNIFNSISSLFFVDYRSEIIRKSTDLLFDPMVCPNGRARSRGAAPRWSKSAPSWGGPWAMKSLMAPAHGSITPKSLAIAVPIANVQQISDISCWRPPEWRSTAFILLLKKNRYFRQFPHIL